MGLAVIGGLLCSGALAADATVPPPNNLSLIVNLVVAATGLFAAIGAFALQWRNRKQVDPRDALLEILIQERSEAVERGIESKSRRASRKHNGSAAQSGS